MFPLERKNMRSDPHLSLSALMWIRSEKEMKETLEGVEGGGMLTGAQQTCPILTHGPRSTDSKETPWLFKPR